MGEVVSLEKEQIILVCGCSCRTFYVHASNVLECASCGHFIQRDDVNWRARLADPPEEIKEEEGNELNVISFSGSKAALERLKTFMSVDELGVAIIILKDGGVKLWSEDYLETTEQRRWFWRKCRVAFGMLTSQSNK